MKYTYLEANGVASVLDTKHNAVLIMVWFSSILVGLGWFYSCLCGKTVCFLGQDFCSPIFKH